MSHYYPVKQSEIVRVFCLFYSPSGIEALGSEQTDPRKALPTDNSGCKGFRMTPLNTSELVS